MKLESLLTNKFNILEYSVLAPYFNNSIIKNIVSGNSLLAECKSPFFKKKELLLKSGLSDSGFVLLDYFLKYGSQYDIFKMNFFVISKNRFNTDGKVLLFSVAKTSENIEIILKKIAYYNSMLKKTNLEYSFILTYAGVFAIVLLNPFLSDKKNTVKKKHVLKECLTGKREQAALIIFKELENYEYINCRK